MTSVTINIITLNDTENCYVVKHVETYISKMTTVEGQCVTTVFFVSVDKSKIYKSMNSILTFVLGQ